MLDFSNKDQSDEPFISVIVPVFNVEKYLPACIESIIHQTYRNMEIILVDDGSTDSCGAICEKYGELDSRIKVIHKKNAGQGEARNTGMEAASGEYFGFADSDDLIHPQMYEILVKCILTNQADVSACTRAQIREDDDFHVVPFDIPRVLSETRVFSGREATKELLQEHRKFKNAVWEKLYKRNLFESERFRSVYAEDREIMYRLLYSAQKVAYLPFALYGYRLREGSTMLSRWNDHKDDMVYQQDEKCLQYFKQRGDTELYDAAVYWHFFWGVENYRRLEGEDKKYRERLKKEMRPYTKLGAIFKTDYPFRRKVEFYIFGLFPGFHFALCNIVRRFKRLTGGWT